MDNSLRLDFSIEDPLDVVDKLLMSLPGVLAPIPEAFVSIPELILSIPFPVEPSAVSIPRIILRSTPDVH